MKRLLISISTLMVVFPLSFCLLQMFDGNTRDLGELMINTMITVGIYGVGIVIAYVAYRITLLFGIIIGGLISGLRFHTLSIFDIVVSRRNGRFSITHKNCLDVVQMGLPLEKKGRWSFFFYNAGSFISQILLASVCIFLLYNYDLSGMIWSMVLTCSILAVRDIILELICLIIPAKTATFGSLVLGVKLCLDKACRERVIKILQVNFFINSGRTLSDMPEELFEDCPLDYDSTPVDAQYRSLYIAYLFAKEQFDELYLTIEKDDVSEKNWIVKDIHNKCRFYVELLTKRRPEVFEQICTPHFLSLLHKEQAFVFLYAYHLLCLGDKEAARNDKVNFENKYFYESDRMDDEKFILFVDKIFEEEGCLSVHPSSGNGIVKKSNWTLLIIFFAIVGMFFAFHYHKQHKKTVFYERLHERHLVTEMENVANSYNEDSLRIILNEVDSFIVRSSKTHIDEYVLSDYFYELRRNCEHRLQVIEELNSHTNNDEQVTTKEFIPPIIIEDEDW